jgi:hypothetical protein
MQSPVGVAHLQTFKSQLTINPDDIICLRDETDTVSIGTNVIADYDKYYVSSAPGTFGVTFLPQSVGTIEDAITSNGITGTRLTQTVTNLLDIRTALMPVKCYKKQNPYVTSARGFFGETFNSYRTVTGATFSISLVPNMTITNAKITAPIYRSMRNRIYKVFYCLMGRLNYFGHGRTSIANVNLLASNRRNPFLSRNFWKEYGGPNPRFDNISWDTSPYTTRGSPSVTPTPGLFLRVNNSNQAIFHSESGHRFNKVNPPGQVQSYAYIIRSVFNQIRATYGLPPKDLSDETIEETTYYDNVVHDVRSFSLLKNLRIYNLLHGQRYFSDGIYETHFTGIDFGFSSDTKIYKVNFQPIGSSPFTTRGYTKITFNNSDLVGFWFGSSSQPVTTGFTSSVIPDTPFTAANGLFGLREADPGMINADGDNVNPIVFQMITNSPVYSPTNNNNTSIAQDYQFRADLDKYELSYGGYLMAFYNCTSTDFRNNKRTPSSQSGGVETLQFSMRDYGDEGDFWKTQSNWTIYHRYGGSTRVDLSPWFTYESFHVKALYMSGDLCDIPMSTTSILPGYDFLPTGQFKSGFFPDDNAVADPGTVAQPYLLNIFSTPPDKSLIRPVPPPRIKQYTRGTIVEGSNIVNATVGITLPINEPTQRVVINNLTSLADRVIVRDNYAGSDVTLANELNTAFNITNAEKPVPAPYDTQTQSEFSAALEARMGGGFRNSDEYKEGKAAYDSVKVFLYWVGDSEATNTDAFYMDFSLGATLTGTYTVTGRTSVDFSRRIFPPASANSPKEFRISDNALEYKSFYWGSDPGLNTFLDFVFTNPQTYTDPQFSISNKQLISTRTPRVFDITPFTIGKRLGPVSGWDLSVSYLPSKPAEYATFYDSQGVSGTTLSLSPTNHTAFFTFNLSGAASSVSVDNGTSEVGSNIPYQTDEGPRKIYELRDVTEVINSGVTGYAVNFYAPLSTQSLLTLTTAPLVYPSTGLNDVHLRANITFIDRDPGYERLLVLRGQSGVIPPSVYAVFNELTAPSNLVDLTIDLSSILTKFLTQDAQGVAGTIPIGVFVSSFDQETQTIEYIKYKFPNEYFASTYIIQDSIKDLTMAYRWGTKYDYEQYFRVFDISTGATAGVQLTDIGNATSTLNSFERPDREKTFSNITGPLYMTFVSTTPRAGYTFTEVPLFIHTVSSSQAYSYKIYNTSNNLLFGSDVSDNIDINNDTFVDRGTTTVMQYASSTIPLDMAPLDDYIVAAGGTYALGHSDNIISISMSGVLKTLPKIINNFVTIENTTILPSPYLKPIPRTLSLFITPRLIPIENPVIPASQENNYYMPECTISAGVRTGIPTIAPGFAYSKYKLLFCNNKTALDTVLNTREIETLTPFSTVTSGVSPDQIDGFKNNDYRLNYFSIPSDSDGNLYVIPFNYLINKETTPPSYVIAYATNYVTLKYFDINSRFVSADPSKSYYPSITEQPLYLTINFDMTDWITANPTYTIDSISSSNLGELTLQEGSTYTYGITFTDENLLFPQNENAVYSTSNNPVYIKVSYVETDNAGATLQNTVNYLTRQHHVPRGLTVDFRTGMGLANNNVGNSDIIMDLNLSVNYAAESNNITFNNQSLDLRYGVTGAFSLVIPNIPENPFILQQTIKSNGDRSIDAIIPLNYLLPNTTYTSSIRYFPYISSSDTSINKLDDAADTRFSFTTPDGAYFSARVSVAYDATNTRICDITYSSIVLLNGLTQVPVSLAGHSFVFITSDPSIELIVPISDGVVNRFASYTTTKVPSTITFRLKRLVRGKYYYPYAYIEGPSGRRSNIIYTGNIVSPAREPITLSSSIIPTLPYQRKVTMKNFDNYVDFIEQDYSFPANEGGTIILTKAPSPSSTNYITRSTTDQILGSFKLVPGATYPANTIEIIANRYLAGYTGTTFNVAYAGPGFDPTKNDLQLVYYEDNTGKNLNEPTTSSMISYIREKIRYNSLLTYYSQQTLLSIFDKYFGDNFVVYGGVVSESYNFAKNNLKSSLPGNIIEVGINSPSVFISFLNDCYTKIDNSGKNENGGTSIVSEFNQSTGTAVFYDPQYTYKNNDETNTDVLKLTSRVNQFLVPWAFGSNAYYSFNNTSKARIMFQGNYAGDEVNPFFSNTVIILISSALVGKTYLRVTLFNTGETDLREYIIRNAPLTCFASVYDGRNVTIGYPEDFATKTTVYRQDVATYTDLAGRNATRFDYAYYGGYCRNWFPGITIHFESQSQIDAWNSKPVTPFFYQYSASPRPLNASPYTLLNRVRYIGDVTFAEVLPQPEYINGTVTTTTGSLGGTVNVSNFNYWAGSTGTDDATNSYPIIFNPSSLSLMDSTGTITYDYATIDSTVQGFDVINFTLGETYLAPGTYQMKLVYKYDSDRSIGTATIPVTYIIPDNTTSIKKFTRVPAIHNVTMTIDPSNIYNNIDLATINTPLMVTAKSTTPFNFKGEWFSLGGYTLGDAVVSGGVLYWYRDQLNSGTVYATGNNPIYGFGWEDTTSYINYVGEFKNAKDIGDVFTYASGIYKVGYDGVSIPPNVRTDIPFNYKSWFRPYIGYSLGDAVSTISGQLYWLTDTTQYIPGGTTHISPGWTDITTDFKYAGTSTRGVVPHFLPNINQSYSSNDPYNPNSYLVKVYTFTTSNNIERVGLTLSVGPTGETYGYNSSGDSILLSFNYRELWSEYNPTYGLGDVVTRNTSIYWLTDLRNYQISSDPLNGNGWTDIGTLLNYQGSFVTGYYNFNLSGPSGYRQTPSDNRAVMGVYTIIPPFSGTIQRNNENNGRPNNINPITNKYLDYSTDIVSGFSQPTMPGATFNIAHLVPNHTYTTSLQLLVGGVPAYGPTKYTDPLYMGQFTTLPDQLRTIGITLREESGSYSAVIPYTSYLTGPPYFSDGMFNYDETRNPKLLTNSYDSSFTGLVGTIPLVDSDLTKAYVSYSPTVVFSTGYLDETAPYKLYTPLISYFTSITNTKNYYNTGVFRVTGYQLFDNNGMIYVPNTSDSIVVLRNGVFYENTYLTNMVVNNDSLRTVDFTIRIEGLTQLTTYTDFSFGYRIRNHSDTTGTIYPIPSFTTTPKLIVNCTLVTAAGRSICKNVTVSYCDEVCGGPTKSTAFLVPDPRNSMIITLGNTQSYLTKTRFQSLPLRIPDATPFGSPLVIEMSGTNINQYTFNEVSIEYTAVNPATLVLETTIATAYSSVFITKPSNISIFG